jgi:quercetin dioxygenase-like cupin family protein
MYYDQPITNGGEARSGSFEGMRADEPFPGVTRRSFDSERATVAAYTFAPGASFPLHRHPQEQITIVQRGRVEMTVGEAVHALPAGAWSIVAPGVAHGVTAGPAGAEMLAIVVPSRERPDDYGLVDAAEAFA